jgi:hypothetical protein
VGNAGCSRDVMSIFSIILLFEVARQLAQDAAQLFDILGFELADLFEKPIT